MKNIVGIGGSGHDFATCLITGDGQVIAVEDERLTRIRYAIKSQRPCQPSLQYCLSTAGLAPDDVDATIGNDVLEPVLDQAAFPRLTLINHHLTHAYSTFFTSPFDEAAILVVDGSGSLTRPVTSARTRETTTYYRGAHNSIDTLASVCGGSAGNSYTPELPRLKANSLGDFYRVLTEAIGFGYLQAGKTMGLASYGSAHADDRFVAEIMRSVTLLPQGQFEISIPGESGLLNNLGRVRQEALSTDDPFQVDAAIAAAGQHVFETLLFHCLEYLWQQTRTPNLCLAGGAALNSMANGKIINATPFKQVHVFFAPGDGGTAIGAALWGAAQSGWAAAGRPVRLPLEPFLGRAYAAERIEDALRQSGHAYARPENLYREVAGLLNQGRVIAWYQGRSEFGPRALGNRSILADPRSAAMREHINHHVKQREWFRPLAPAVIEAAAATYFEPSGFSPWMQFVWPVRAEYQDVLGAVTHVDGSARVQIVRRADNPAFYRLLEAFQDLSGLPVLLNTSFNTEGGPIVETPEEAIQTVAESRIDALAIGDFLMLKPT